MSLSGYNRYGTLIELLTRVRRRLPFLIIWIVVCLGAGILYLRYTPEEFTATTQIILEPPKQVPIGSDLSNSSANLALDSAQADSQLQVMKSERNLRFVFQTLNLVNDPAYNSRSRGIFHALREIMRFSHSGTKEAQIDSSLDSEKAYLAFAGQVSVRRLPGSYVLETSVRAQNPHDASRLANAVTASYIRGQIVYRAASGQQGQAFLQNRIADIEEEKKVAAEWVRTGVITEFQFPDSDARIVSVALDPLTKSFPSGSLIMLIACVFGLVTSSGALLIEQSIDRTIRHRSQVDGLSSVPCLDVLPKLGKKGGSYENMRLVIDNPHSEYASIIRKVRTLIFSLTNENSKASIGIVSFNQSAARSYFASNLAYLISASSDDVVLIDADLAHGKLTKQLQPDALKGLNDLLIGHQPADGLPEAVINPNLTFIASTAKGTQANPNAFIGSHVVQQAMLEIQKNRDIIVDLPPISSGVDAQALGHLLTAVIVIGTLNETKYEHITESISAMQKGKAHVIGIVLSSGP